MPRTPPFGFSPTQSVYVLHAVDIGNDLIEGAGESDNSGLGSGIDSRQLTVTDNPPTGDDPVIGTFTLSHESVPRGTKIDLTLTGVVDNSGVVNDVHLFDDANDNGQLDPSDPRVHVTFSRLGDRVTGRLDTSILAVGSHTLMAVAEDNFRNWSAPALVTLDVAGIGAATPDRFEANDARTTPSFVGTGPVIVERNLSITPGDIDWISFANYGTADLRVRIDFVEEEGFPVAPGDLYSQLYPYGSNSQYGFSDRSSAGVTFEEITRSNLPSGRYVIGIAAQGAGNSNDDYKLTIELTSRADYPTSSNLSLSSTELRPESTLTATLNNVRTYGGSTVDGVVFYADKNRNFVRDVNDEFLGWGQRVWDWDTFEWTNNFEWSGPVADWGTGDINVIAYPVDSFGRSGLSFDEPVTIRRNIPPMLATMAAPREAALGDSFTLMAEGFSDPEGASPAVRFEYDSNGDGITDTDIAGILESLPSSVQLAVDS
ncbi:MAG: hypothetical protein KDA59_26710, partial [Planctomycetales bacterium]|nr:hypothetical protein [Planctomycetales bacterium]